MAQIDSIRYCACGCGKILPRFIKGHNSGTANRGKILRPDDPRGPNPSGLCMCGCGKPVSVSQDCKNGRVTGCYVRFLKGHDKVTVKRIGNPLGLCMCGCGRKTAIAKQTRLGNIAGEPQMYRPGHRHRRAHVVTVTGCWELDYLRTKEGYTRIRRDGVLRLGHSWYWEQMYGPVPDGLELDHTCENRACVNPDHLEPVTHQENMRRVALRRALRKSAA